MSKPPSHGLPGYRAAAELVRKQQGKHLLALYASACNCARQLEAAIVDGQSPTGYGAPLAPLAPDQARAVVAPVRQYVADFRALVEQWAPDELVGFETCQSRENTLVWASNLLENLRQLAEELHPRRLRRYGAGLSSMNEAMTQACRRLLSLIEQARDALEEK